MNNESCHRLVAWLGLARTYCIPSITYLFATLLSTADYVPEVVALARGAALDVQRAEARDLLHEVRCPRVQQVIHRELFWT